MPESVPQNESREDILHVPNLFDFFCQRTAAEMRSRGGTAGEAPATSFAFLVITVLIAFALFVFGKPQLAKAVFVFFGVLLLWTVWGVIIRSTEQVSQKADNIKAGVFPAVSAPFVMARLKWWNHLVVPHRWGKHSRLFDRKGKLERKIEELEKRVNEAVGAAGLNTEYTPPADQEVVDLAEKLNAYSDRTDYESELAKITDEVVKARAELVLFKALLHRLNEMLERLDRIDKLAVTFQNVSPDDLSQVVSEAIQLLEERRILVLGVDTIDPDDFIDMVTARSS